LIAGNNRYCTEKRQRVTSILWRAIVGVAHDVITLSDIQVAPR
jgi:hypothetical protein